MSVLWARDPERFWAALPLDDEDGLLLSEHPPRRLRDSANGNETDSRVVLAPADAVGWVLLWGPGRVLHINGLPQETGLRVLEDRDEIRVAGAGTVFFSTESLARVEPFPGADHRVDCPRSKRPIEKGTPAVCCPCCGIWYLMTHEVPAWTYSERCLFCPQPTDLEAGYQWSPEEP